MKLSVLHLEGYYVKELRFSLVPEVEANMNIHAHPGLHYIPAEIEKVDTLTVSVASDGTTKIDDPYRWRIQINIESKNPAASNYPYTFNISLVGFFRMSSSILVESVETLVRTLGTAFLYSAAREVLASATGRGPYPAVMLPVVTFQDSPVIKPLTEEISAPEQESSKKVRTRAGSTKSRKRKISTPQQD